MEHDLTFLDCHRDSQLQMYDINMFGGSRKSSSGVSRGPRASWAYHRPVMQNSTHGLGSAHCGLIFSARPEARTAMKTWWPKS